MPANSTKSKLPANRKAKALPLVAVEHGEPVTTSLLIAEKFGKQHKDVLRAIKNLECSDEFGRRNFAPSSYLNEQQKEQPMYHITEAGFAFLAMGFTGKEAAAWKEKFIEAFQGMRRELLRLARQKLDPEWQRSRLAGIEARRLETDAIQLFVEYAQARGSRNARHYYANVSRMVSRAVLGDPTASRDRLPPRALHLVAQAEQIARQVLLDGMARQGEYHEVFRAAWWAVAAYGAAIAPLTKFLTRP